MESNSQFSNMNNNTSTTDENKQKKLLDNPVEPLGLTRPTMLPTGTNTDVTVRYSAIDNISMSPSPLDTRPRLFQAGSLIDSKTYAQMLSEVYAPPNIKCKEEEEEYNSENLNNVTDEQLFDEEVLDQQREQEIQRLTQVIRTDQPKDGNVAANIIMQQLNDILETTRPTINCDNNDPMVPNQLETSSIISTVSQHPYPPVNQTGLVHDHDLPYADYGHLSRQTIAEECHFNLQVPTGTGTATNKPTVRLEAKSFAITTFTNVSKELVMNKIKEEFGIENIQYICIGEEISELNHQRHLHIQIIFKEKIDRRKPFLDDITETHCNYQVTQNDCAWNEYIKKGGNCIEFNEFKSTKTRGGQKYWPPQTPSSSSSHMASSTSVHPTTITINHPTTTTTITTTTTTTTVRAQAEERRKTKELIARQAIELAKSSVHDALIFMRDNSIATEFVRYATWYKNSFTLIYSLELYEKAKMKKNLKPIYAWPESFPDCTSELREVVNRWIREELHHTSRAKCLILIGPTGTGKTTFAKSLPGQYNFFSGRWLLDTWNDSASYLIFDDIDWDRFEELGFPLKTHLLTQNGVTNTTDKYEKTIEIDVKQPAIVLLKPGAPEGALGRQPITYEDECAATFWQQRAIIYRMGPNEFFYKPMDVQDDVNN
ncbi:unnamed protein product [Rotaria sp. Silwood1]|nr:unnamed protein product [Rotaria sp. Silwood1]CAF4822323.1 unnamed protein product [Rotaria sp. Silwood1]